jgi:signal transduction histidine kinase/ActR/RegA family two-component response regulator
MHFATFFKRKKPQPASLRTHLVILVLAPLLPLLFFAALMFWRDVQLQYDAVERGMRNTARALSLAVDRDIGNILAVAQTLAASPHINAENVKAFYELSAGAAKNSNIAAIALFDRRGEMIINTTEQFGKSLPNPLQATKGTPESRQDRLPQGNQAIKRVLETGQPLFSDLFRGLVSKLTLLSVTVPVLNDGKVAYALSVAVTSDHLTDLLREQGLPAHWMAVLVDRKGIIIARTAAPERFVGQPAGSPLVQRLSRDEEGWDAGSSQEGVPIYYSFARSKLTGWGVAIAAPQVAIDAPMHQSITILTAGAVPLLLVAVCAAFVFGRRITIPISRLAQSAEAIHRGENIDFGRSVVTELEQLHEALLDASAVARAAESERQQRILADAKRAEAEKAQEALQKFADQLENRVTERTEALRSANDALRRDIEERKRLEQQLIQAQKMESIGTLAGGIAHDFNNLLNIIQGYSFLLRNSQGHVEQLEESLNTIDETVQRGTALVQQLLTVAQKTSGKPTLLNSNLVVEGLIKIVRETFPKNIEVSSSLYPNLPPVVADKTQFEQIVLNLLVNARDAMPEGGRLWLETSLVPRAELNFSGATADRYVCIKVADSGIGMDQSTRNRIFEPFFTTKNKSQSTGLGLSVVYGILKNHNGFVEVDSKPGLGATFRVYLPVSRSSHEKIPPRVNENEPRAMRSDQASTILVVEDEVKALDFLSKVLLRQGYNIFKASDGQMALQVFEQHKENIDAVLLDLGLPKITGTDVLRKIKHAKPNVTIVIASGFFEAELETEIGQAGIAAFLQKPYRPDEVIRTIDSALRREL